MSNISNTFYVRLLAKLLRETSRLWDDFADDIRYNNRFFPQKSQELENALQRLIQQTTVIPLNTRFYRARNMKMFPCEGFHYRNKKLWGYDQKNMEKAPRDNAMAGRANPQHISYLYLASNRQTACSEIRAGLHDIISIMEFRTTKEIKVIDLTQYNWQKKDDFTLFFWKVQEAFSIHCSEQSDTFYAPTQYLSSYFASQEGILGIKFPTARDSSETSYNLVLFSDECVKQMHRYSEVFVCSSVSYSFDDLNEKSHSITGNSSIYSENGQGNPIKTIRNDIVEKNKKE